MSLVKSIGKQKVNVDFNKDFINLFSEKIKSKDVAFINQTLEDLHAADVADLIENLDTDTRNKLIEIEVSDPSPVGMQILGPMGMEDIGINIKEMMSNVMPKSKQIKDNNARNISGINIILKTIPILQVQTWSL